ncbi:helix-turn-helix domain-containing protein [Microbacterium sp. CFBP9034]|uniref:helix-turn-helix domain-containing protein n=1 Tax=Microbacterium sp. CFBP9034 TaxID=3096540 RepID=UPI002A69F4BA|nr:helix-turn-helix domain-containing protein [Microbacterium sp. CFBP9034]MDY0911050.1 helix-turn-helix domain-containing protein [Microbacterium sp. CFBP9034]
MTDPTRGILYPERLPHLQRLPAPDAAADLVGWFWVPEWDLPPGVASRQQVLAFPAANLVVEPSGVTLWGATTRVSERVLEGRGWAVGALLKPAALAVLSDSPADLVDSFATLDEPDLHAAVRGVMPGGAEAAVARMAAWVDARVGVRTGEARLAADMAELLMTDATILRVEDAAARLSVSPRTLQRLAHRTVGLPPATMIRRRRLQEAAQHVREDPDASLAEIAVSLGYADQAHLANDFRTVLGMTATEYRSER